MKRAIAALIATLIVLPAVLVVLAAPALAAPTFPPLTGRVVDQADIIPADVEAKLTAKLAALEAQTGDQFVVATVKSLQGYDIQDYGYQLGRHWGIGQKDKNNGVILLVAPNERKVGFEVGYGLEGTLTDALTKTIIENAIVPRFRANDMAGGIQRGVDDTIQVLAGDAGPIQELAAKRPADSGLWNGLVPIFLMFILWIVLGSLFRGGRSRGLLGTLFWAGMWSSSGRSWSRGSSWGGSSGGGFSGGGGGFSGGGGSFGGGGSSGSW